ncbi:MAG: TIGR03435 family protein [Terracidiphilus sp.]
MTTRPLLRAVFADPAIFAGLLAFAPSVLFVAAPVMAQTTPATAAPQSPAWQTAAGGHMEFEAASIRLAAPGARFSTNVNLNMEDEPIPIGGRFSATASLGSYIAFAYKLMPGGPQSEAAFAHQPKWVTADFFDIEAKAAIANPSKDQMRLMMQSLLADRFKLALHFEARDVPVMALVLVEPGKLGPRLRPHSKGPPCDAKIPPVDRNSPKIPDVWRQVCGDIQNVDWTNNTVILGSRNTTMELLAGFVPLLEQLDRPVVDQTGLSGNFDYEVSFTPPWKIPKEQSTDTQLDLTGPTFLEGLKDQLGLRLKPTRALIQVLVIDHVEEPSAN